MSTQHAPGPWYAFEGYDDDDPQYTVESSVTIAYIRESTFNPNPKATAQLMAAAPDLLDALRIAHDHIDMDALEVSHCKDAKRIRAAIAKAEGGAA
jgi:hypothetical protein